MQPETFETLADAVTCLEHTAGEPVDLVFNFVSSNSLSVMVAVSRDAALLWVSQWDSVSCLRLNKGAAAGERV